MQKSSVLLRNVLEFGMSELKELCGLCYLKKKKTHTHTATLKPFSDINSVKCLDIFWSLLFTYEERSRRLSESDTFTTTTESCKKNSGERWSLGRVLAGTGAVTLW